MPFAETALGIGAILGGAASAGSAVSAGGLNRKNRKWQEKMYNLQVTQRREDAQAQYERMKDYASWAYNKFESPVAQRAAYAAAGVNPFVEGSALQPMGTPQGNVSQADGGSVPSQGPYQNNPMSNIMAGASSLREAALQGVQAENIQAQTEYTNAQRLKTVAETKGIENTNSLFDFVRSAAESDALSKRFKAKIDQVNAEFAEIKAIQDSEERDARIAELWSREENNLAQAAKTDADRLTVETLRDGMKRLQDAQIENTQAQTETEGAKQSNLSADTDYKQALKRTEDDLRDGRVRLTDQQANKVIEDVFGARISQMREADELSRVLTGTDRTSSLWGLVDKLIESASRGDNGPVSQEIRDRYYRDILDRVTKSR